MRRLEVVKDLDLDGPGNDTATGSQDLSDGTHPFVSGATVLAVLQADSWSEAEANACGMALKGRDSTSDSWTDLAVLSSSAYPLVIEPVTLPRYIAYANQSGTAGDGRGSIYLIGN